MATPTSPKPAGGGQGLTYGLPSWRQVPPASGYGNALTGEQVSQSGPDYFGMEQRPPAGWGLPYNDVMGGAYAQSQALHPENPYLATQVQYFPNRDPLANLLGSFPPPSFFGGLADLASIDRRGLRPEGPSGEELGLRGQLRGLTDEEYNLALQGYDAMEGRIGTQEGRVRSDLQTRLAQLGRGYNERAQDIARAIEEYQARKAFTQGGIDYTQGVAARTEAKRPQALEDVRTAFSSRGLEFGGQKNRGVAERGEQFNELARQYGEQVRGYQESLRQYEEGIEQQRIGADRAKLDYEEALTGTKTEADRALEDYKYARGELGRDRAGASIGYRGKKLSYELQDVQERDQLSWNIRQWERQGSVQAAEAKAARKAEAEMDTWMTARVNELARYGMDPATAQSITISEARQKWGGEVPETYISGAMKPEQSPLYKTYGVDISPFAGAQFSPKRQQETRAGATYRTWENLVKGYASDMARSGGPVAPEAVMRMIHDNWVLKGKEANAQLKRDNPGAKNLKLEDVSETAWREYVRAKHGAFSMLLFDAEDL